MAFSIDARRCGGEKDLEELRRDHRRQQRINELIGRSCIAARVR